MIFVFDRVENNLGKGENAGYQHFVLFPQCFQKASFLDSLKVGIVWERVQDFDFGYCQIHISVPVRQKEFQITKLSIPRERIKILSGHQHFLLFSHYLLQRLLSVIKTWLVLIRVNLLNYTIWTLIYSKNSADDQINKAELISFVLESQEKYGKKRKCWQSAFSPFRTIFF